MKWVGMNVYICEFDDFYNTFLLFFAATSCQTQTYMCEISRS